MKICNNCSTVNNDEAERCIQCKMPDNFTLQGVAVPPLQLEAQTLVCRNCGSHQPGDGPKCTHCRFPLPELPGSATTFVKPTVKGSLRVG